LAGPATRAGARARSLDLDLIGWADRILPDKATVVRWMDLPPAQQMQSAPDELILPHPRVQDRAFVLVPLMDIAPQWVHPVTGQSVAAMHGALPKADLDAINPLVNLGEGA